VHLAAAEHDDRLRGRQKPGGKVAKRIALGVTGRRGVGWPSGRGAPAAHSAPTGGASRVGGLVYAGGKLLAGCCRAVRLSRRPAGCCAQGPGRVVPGTLSDPS